MLYRIIRGSIVGVLLGVLFGAVISTSTGIKELYKREGALLSGANSVEAMAMNTDGKIASATNSSEQNLEEVLLRFHVRANSNREEDIELKYKVRDAVIEMLGKKLDHEMSREEVISVIEDNMDEIKAVAKKTVKDAGYGYAIKAYITKDEFPMRQYGNIVLPAGEYDALRIDIGLARGENFWCILYPMMCVTKSAVAVVSESEQGELKEAITDEQYEKLFIKHEKCDVKIRFKFLEILGLQ